MGDLIERADRWERIAGQRMVEIQDKADEITALRERVGVLTVALEKLIVAIEFEAPPIRDGVNVAHRLDVLARLAHDARAALKTPDA